MEKEELIKRISEMETEIADIKKQSGFFELHEHTGFDSNAIRDLLTVPMTFASTVYTNAGIGIEKTIQFEFTATSNFTLANPTNSAHGKKIMYKIKQDSTGSRVITYGSNFRGSTDQALPTLTTTALYVDYIGFSYDAVVGKWNCLGKMQGFAT